MFTPTIIKFPEAASTNALAVEMLKNERPAEGTVIITDRQTHGRGMDKNTWESEPHKNLTFSIILYPDIAVEEQFFMNKAICLSVYDCVSELLTLEKVYIKWPNDIYAGDKKICGILIQNSVLGNKLEHAIAGIGLNVNQTVFTGAAPNPVSLKNINRIDYNLDKTLERLLKHLQTRYSQLKHKNYKTINSDYLSALYRINQYCLYIINNESITAKITGISPYGQLELQSNTEKLYTCDVKEVKFVL